MLTSIWPWTERVTGDPFRMGPLMRSRKRIPYAVQPDIVAVLAGSPDNHVQGGIRWPGGAICPSTLKFTGPVIPRIGVDLLLEYVFAGRLPGTAEHAPSSRYAHLPNRWTLDTP